jgi:methylmalonyl-CoA/ethylmalonyl-CoA epimerase
MAKGRSVLEPRLDHAVPAQFGLDARLDHVAFAAPRIRDLLALYVDLLGAEPLFGGDNTRVGYRGLQIEFPDHRRVELLEPLQHSTFFDRFFDRTGGGGMHHITFLVPDIELALESVIQSGYQPTSVDLDDPKRLELFLHPKQAFGTLVQLVQSGKWQPPVRDPDTVLAEVLAGHGTDGNGEPSP